MSHTFAFIINQKDNLSLKRIINTPRRAIGDKSVAEIESYAEELGLSLYDGLKYVIDNNLMSKGIISKLKGFTELVNTLLEEKEAYPPDEFVKRPY